MKQLDEISSSVEMHLECCLCNSRNVTTRQVERSFPVGKRGTEKILSAEIPVHRCTDCEFEFITPEGDMIQHNAVCRILKVMTPSEVHQVRKKYDLSQAEFSEKTGIDLASIKSWEKGGRIQSRAMDNYLYLIGISNNLDALSSRTS